MKVDITSGTLSAALISASVLVAWVPTRDESGGAGSSNGPAIEDGAAAPRGRGREANVMPVLPVPADLAVTTSRRTPTATRRGASVELELDMSTIADQIATHRPMLVRAARQRLRNDAWAEDAVSETLVAALGSLDAYSGRSSVRTWLVGILKHKVVDQIRRHTRERQLTTPDDDESEVGDLPDATRGDTTESRAGWGDPVQCLIRRQFTEHLGRCMRKLPAQQARAVMLRDCMEEESGDICNKLGVTSNNLGVILHRARGALRASLHIHCSLGLG